MSASRSWVVKPYRVFPPTCRYRQWPPPQIAVPGSLRLPMIFLAFRSHPVVCFPPPRKGSRRFQHRRVQGRDTVPTPQRKVARSNRPDQFPDGDHVFPSLKEGFKGGGTGISSGCSSEVSIPLGHGARYGESALLSCAGGACPGYHEVYKRTASSGEAAERPAQPVRQLSDRCNSRCSLMKPLIRPLSSATQIKDLLPHL